MLLDNKPYTFDRVVRLALGVGLVVGLVWLLGYLSDVLIPFAVALLLAYLLNPLVGGVQKKVRNRTGAVLVSLAAVTAGFLLAAAVVVPLVVREIAHTGAILSDLVNNSELAQEASRRLPPDLWQFIKDAVAQYRLQELFSSDNLLQLAEAAARKVLPGLWSLISGTTSFLLGLFGFLVVLLYLVFLLIDFERVKNWRELVPAEHQEAVVSFVNDFESALQRYFRAQALVAALVGVLFAVGFSIIGLPLGILLGLFIGVLNMVPYLQVIGLVPAFALAVLHALETGGSIGMALLLTGLVFAAVQTIQDVILTPRIMGREMGLSPAVMLLSLSVWGKLLGLLGLLIALPMTCLFLVYYQRFVLARSPRTAAGADPAKSDPTGDRRPPDPPES